MIFRKIALLLILCGLMPLSAQEENSDFELLIFPSDWLSLGLGYYAEPAFEKLQAGDYSSAIFRLTSDDLDSYHWEWQALSLSSAATQRLIESLPKLDERQADVQALMDLKSSMSYGNPLQNALYAQPFIVLVDSEFLYGGIFLDVMSQMAINYPVIRVEIAEGQAVFHILPTHIPFVEYDPVPREDPKAAFTPILDGDRASAPEFFQDAVDGWANSATSNYFREWIRNERLYEILQEADKLWVESD